MNESATPATTSQHQANGHQLALRRVAIDTWRENVVYLNRDCDLYRAEGFQALAKVEVDRKSVV